MSDNVENEQPRGDSVACDATKVPDTGLTFRSGADFTSVSLVKDPVEPACYLGSAVDHRWTKNELDAAVVASLGTPSEEKVLGWTKEEVEAAFKLSQEEPLFTVPGPHDAAMGVVGAVFPTVPATCFIPTVELRWGASDYGTTRLQQKWVDSYGGRTFDWRDVPTEVID